MLRAGASPAPTNHDRASIAVYSRSDPCGRPGSGTPPSPVFLTLTPIGRPLRSPCKRLILTPIGHASNWYISRYFRPLFTRRDLYFMTTQSTRRHVQTPPATDLYNIDALLSEEERMVRDTVRKYVNERVLPIIGEHFEAGTFPRELIPEVAGLGLLGMHLEGYGCAGLSAVCYGLACQELEAGDSGLRSFVSVQGSLARLHIHPFGSEGQK